MSKSTKRHREHAGAKNSSAKAGYWGKRADAKADSKKSRRVTDKGILREWDFMSKIHAVPFLLNATPKPEPGDYVELDENGVVFLYRKDGTPVMFMALSVYLELCKERAHTG